MPTTRADPSRNAPPGSVCLWNAFGQYACTRPDGDDLFRNGAPAAPKTLAPYLPLPESFADGVQAAPPRNKTGAPTLLANATLEGFCGCGGPAPLSIP